VFSGDGVETTLHSRTAKFNAIYRKTMKRNSAISKPLPLHANWRTKKHSKEQKFLLRLPRLTLRNNVSSKGVCKITVNFYYRKATALLYMYSFHTNKARKTIEFIRTGNMEMQAPPSKEKGSRRQKH
jgi:hypothetical protein